MLIANRMLNLNAIDVKTINIYFFIKIFYFHRY